jgi:hypothetical protein
MKFTRAASRRRVWNGGFEVSYPGGGPAVIFERVKNMMFRGPGLVTFAAAATLAPSAAHADTLVTPIIIGLLQSAGASVAIATAVGGILTGIVLTPVTPGLTLLVRN